MNLKVLLTKLLSLLNTPFKTAVYTTGSITVPKYGGGASLGVISGTHAFSAVSGYTPLGVLSYYMGGTKNSTCWIQRLYTSGTTMYYTIANQLTSSAATVTIKYRVLYVKSGLTY